MSSALYWKQQIKARNSRRVVWLTVVLMISIVAWANWAKLDEVIVGSGKVVPARAIQQIQSLEGGILESLHVQQGQVVEQGQLLAMLDNTQSKAAWLEAVQQRKALEMLIYEAELELKSIALDNKQKNWRKRISVKPLKIDVSQFSTKRGITIKENYEEHISQLISLLNLENNKIEQAYQAVVEVNNKTKTLNGSVLLSQEEINLTKKSVEKGAVSKIELLKLQRKQINLRGELSSSKVNAKRLKAAYEGAITDRENLVRRFRFEIRNDVTEAKNKLAQLEESQPALENRLQRAALYSPLNGRVKRISRRTLGGVIKPGESIMEIIPDTDKLIIETRVRPQDIAYVRLGLPAMIKFTAYDFVIYGGEEGVVTYISADALQDEEGEAYYKVNVETPISSQSDFNIIPGMQASVDIKTGKKSVLNYWLKPLLRAQATALREP